MAPGRVQATHVIPVGDVIDHDLDRDCPCGPRLVTAGWSDGSYNWQLVHQSLRRIERSESAG